VKPVFVLPQIRSLRAQLLWWLMPPLALVCVVGTMFAYYAANKYANRAYDDGLFDTARALAQQVKLIDGKAQLELRQQAIEILEFDPYDKVYFRVLGPDWRGIAGREDLPLPALPPSVESPVRYYDSQVGGIPVRVAAFSAFDAKGHVQFTVLSAETLIKRQILAQHILLTVVLPQLVLIFVVALLLVYGVRRGLVPLRRLADAVTRRGYHDLSIIDDIGSPEEVRPLTRSINELIRRLGYALSAQQRFIADAAHQLRTPLAGLSAQTERALDETRIEDMKPALEQIWASSKRATHLVNQLLTLARSDPNRAFTDVDLAQLLPQTTMEWVPKALTRCIDLGYSGTEQHVFVSGDPVLLREMLNNIIDNAIAYGQDSGAITVRLLTTPVLQIQVEDNGSGIPEHERERVFERFYRVPGSSGNGCGLGLAIVRQIAQAHGASVTIESSAKGSGATVCITFGNVTAFSGAGHPAGVEPDKGASQLLSASG
jgi:two-component system, OmpR family, sensor histidine kinase TctE